MGISQICSLYNKIASSSTSTILCSAFFKTRCLLKYYLLSWTNNACDFKIWKKCAIPRKQICREHLIHGPIFYTFTYHHLAIIHLITFHGISFYIYMFCCRCSKISPFCTRTEVSIPHNEWLSVQNSVWHSDLLVIPELSAF